MSSPTPAVGVLRNPEENSLRDICSVLFRHKWKSILLFLVIVGVVALGTFTAPDVYESQAKIFLKPGRETLIAEATLPQAQTISVRRTAEEELRSELEILNSRLLAERVVEKIGAKQFLSARSIREEAGGDWWTRIGLRRKLTAQNLAVREVMTNLHAQALRSSNILDVTFQCRNADLARKTLDNIVTAYLDRHLEVYQTEAAVGFFDRQADRLHKDLEAVEDQLREFKSTASIADLKEQRTRMITRLSDLEAKAADATAQLAAARMRMAQLETAFAQLPDKVVLEERTGVEYRYSDDARLRLFGLRLEEKELLSQYPENNRLVVGVRERIRQAENDLEGEPKTRTEVTTGLNVAYQNVQIMVFSERATVAALSEQKLTLDEQVAALRSQLMDLSDNETELVRLERNRDMAEKNFRMYADRFEESRTAQALEIAKLSNVSIVEPATSPMAPVKPRKALNMIVALILGVLGGIGIAFLSEHLDHSFHRREQVERRLGIPVLVSIPKTSNLISLRG